MGANWPEAAGRLLAVKEENRTCAPYQASLRVHLSGDLAGGTQERPALRGTGLRQRTG